MAINFFINGALGLLPVAAFLAVLLQSDTFKLIRARLVFLLILAGVGAAIVSYFAGGFLMRQFNIDYAAFSLFGGPLLEEATKALVVALLIHTHRIGFGLDSAIAGFAIGAGFALCENYFYLQVIGENHAAAWVVRGFGTAIMHGGATAIFAVVAILLMPKKGKGSFLYLFPGFAAAFALHATFNQFLAYPVASTIVMLIGLAGTLAFIFKRNRKSIEQLVDADFESHRQLLDEIRAGRFSDQGLGRVLKALQGRFKDAEIADFVRYIQLHTELLLYVEALLRARDRGALVYIDVTAVEKLDEFHALEKAIGRAARALLHRHLHFSRRQYFELYMLDREAEVTQVRAAM